MSTTTTDIVRIENDQIGQQFLAHKEAFVRMLGGPAEAERFIQEAFAAVNANPFLRNCTLQSLFGALYFAAQIGLPVGGPLQQFHLTPRQVYVKDLGRKVWQVVPVVGYNGLITLAMNTGEYDAIEGKLVYANDEFEPPWDDETGTHFKLRPAPEGKRGALIGVIGRALVKGADRALVEYLDIDTVRDRMRPHEWEKTPWKTDEAAMVKKTGVRRVSKYTAKSRVSWKFALALEADQAVLEVTETGDLNIDHTDTPTEDWRALIEATTDKADLEALYQRMGNRGELTDDLTARVLAHASTLTVDSRSERQKPSADEVAAAQVGRDPAEPDENEWAALRASQGGDSQ